MRLGLIAMSGIRVQNSDLLALGLTLPGVIERSKVVAALPSLALLTLAGLTPDDVVLSYIEVEDLSETGEPEEEFDVVAISSYTAQIKDAYQLAQHYRQNGTKVLLGGLHVTALPDEAQKYADAIILGEAENVWTQVIEDLKHDRLQKRYDARGISFDLNQAPMPRYDLLDPDKYNRITVQTHRGCPLSCEFCAASIRLSPKFKTKPIPLVISEIQMIKRIWQSPYIEFADDNTFANKAHSKRMMKELSKENVRWFTETDISVADDDELLQMIRDAGCDQLLVGLEAPYQKDLYGLELKSDWKAKRADRYLDAIHKIQSYGITVNGCFVLGLDSQDHESFDHVKQFVMDSGLYEVQVTLQTPFPGTPLYTRLENEDRLLYDSAWEKCTLFDMTFKPNKMSALELESGFHRLVSELYSDEAIKHRRRGFFERLREQRALD